MSQVPPVSVLYALLKSFTTGESGIAVVVVPETVQKVFIVIGPPVEPTSPLMMVLVQVTAPPPEALHSGPRSSPPYPDLAGSPPRPVLARKPKETQRSLGLPASRNNFD